MKMTHQTWCRYRPVTGTKTSSVRILLVTRLEARIRSISVRTNKMQGKNKHEQKKPSRMLERALRTQKSWKKTPTRHIKVRMVSKPSSSGTQPITRLHNAARMLNRLGSEEKMDPTRAAPSISRTATLSLKTILT